METLPEYGAFAFGIIIGWYVYFINRYRKADVQLSDLVTLIGIIGGGAILDLFPEGTNLFGAYGIGLAVGFFAYFIVLIFMVGSSKNFNMDFFLDGRRKKPEDPYYVPEEWDGGVRGMSAGGGGDNPLDK